MQIILNYKSYYEAFKQGVTDDGFTPVAELLFYPIFKDNNILDENNVPYAVNNQNASRWGNGQSLIQKEIQAAVGSNEMLERLIDYFKSQVIATVSDALADDMYDAMQELVKNCDLRESGKKRLLKYYENGEYGEFLARVFQRALLGNNKVSPSKAKKKASDANSDSIAEFYQLAKNRVPKPKTEVPEEIQPEELGYVTELYSAYGDANGTEVSKPEDLDIIDCRDHFNRQRKNYYLAETIYRKTRDSMRQDEQDTFELLKDEIDDGVYEISHKKYSNGLEKADAVLDRSGGIEISYNTQNELFNWIGPGEKKGVCHMLVNDKRLWWVKKDEQSAV